MPGNQAPDERVKTDSNPLVERARRGDQAAFSELVRIHQPEVYTLAVRLTGDPVLAADITQEALVRAWRSIGRFRGEAAFGTWLYRITANAAWTWKGRAARHAGVDLEAVGPRLRSDRRHDPEAAGERAELRARLDRALDRLPKAQRSIVILKDVYGWSHQEIAAALSISVTAAKVRLHRAHLKLREMLR